MAKVKRIDKMKNLDRYYKLQKKKLDRLSDPDKKESLDFSLIFTAREIMKIQSKGRLIKSRYKITRADVLRKVLLNLDDEDLICFLGLWKPK